MKEQYKGTYKLDRNAYILGGEPMIFHCHHYNVFLQASIENAKDYIQVYPILIDSAQEVAYSQFKNVFDKEELSRMEKTNLIEELHVFAGYGTLDLSKATEEGGNAVSKMNHHAEGWKSKFGARKEDEQGVCFFTSGFIAGALDAIVGELGRYSVEQILCVTKEDATNGFKITRNAELKTSLEESPQEGVFQSGIELQNHPDSNVNYVGIREALTGMPIEGGEDGLISVFGVMLTRMYSNYYTLISCRFLQEMEENVGEMGIQMAEDLLIEAGHVCAFNTFGGIMESAEWEGLIKPMLKTREDWVHGIVACLNSLGWGHISIKELVANKKLVLEVKSGYENNMYKKRISSSERPMALFKVGATAGIMNLIYHGDITENPNLTEAYYQKIFKAEGRFVGKQIKCRSMGDEFDEFIATHS